MKTPAIVFEENHLKIIDQTLLPARKVYVRIDSIDQCVEAINMLRVRGAPAIGIFAAYGLYISSRRYLDLDYESFKKVMDKHCQKLLATRPTAVNLAWATSRIKNVYQSKTAQSIKQLVGRMKQEALKIHHEDKEACHQIGINGLAIVPNPVKILTHCNTGSLATGGWGTALGIIYAAHQNKYNLHVYVDETRPLGQGARLTFWELMQNEVPCTLITDSAVGTLMQQKRIDLVLFGADRIARNGDVANKIGSYSIAALARFHGIPCYAVAPSSTFDLSIADGNHIKIELRNSQEILHIYGYNDNLINLAGVHNPAFDITPADYLTGIITEKGIIEPANEEEIYKSFNNL